ncbi:hypothetical protein EVAR_14929_1 [Eumeta japonica]|uniref:Uncharacterized protein n=1 Tax=Eumeta variegata TaxID=151549 RepID=A0A4C1XMK6_EUMVA|nr:hypothetical protein EVAR_14929_1 [Eumeta japonica]
MQNPARAQAPTAAPTVAARGDTAVKPAGSALRTDDLSRAYEYPKIVPGEQLACVATMAAYLEGSATIDQGLSPEPDISTARWNSRPAMEPVVNTALLLTRIDQNRIRVDWCKKMIEKYNRSASKAVLNINKDDESWMYAYDPETKLQSMVWVLQAPR